MATPSATESPIRVLLIDDDRDDFLLTRSLIAEIPGSEKPDEVIEACGDWDVSGTGMYGVTSRECNRRSMAPQVVGSSRNCSATCELPSRRETARPHGF